MSQNLCRGKARPAICAVLREAIVDEEPVVTARQGQFRGAPKGHILCVTRAAGGRPERHAEPVALDLRF